MDNMKMMVVTNDALEDFAKLNGLKLAKTRRYVTSYLKAVDNLSNGAWKLCETVYNTCKAYDFKEAFGTRENYAKILGISKSAISKYERACVVRDELLSHCDLDDDGNTTSPYDDITVGQVSELLGIALEDVHHFCVSNDITDKTSCKKIREFVKIYKEGIAEDTAAEDTAEDTAAEDTAAEGIAEDTAAEDTAEDTSSDVITEYTEFNGVFTGVEVCLESGEVKRIEMSDEKIRMVLDFIANIMVE